MSVASGILGSMPEEARQFWVDARYRHIVLGDVVASVTYPERLDRLEAAVSVVDRAIEIGLGHLGVPRGAINHPVRVEPRALGRNAVKYEDCSLILSSSYLRLLPRLYSSLDPAFRTWVHESIHARQPYSMDWRAEYEQWEGYEEGLADGMADVLCTWAGAVIPEATDYVAYNQAYRALAAVLQMPPWNLLRRIWSAPTGRVRTHFTAVVDERYYELAGHALSERGLRAVGSVADDLFTTGRVEATDSDDGIEARWRETLT